MRSLSEHSRFLALVVLLLLALVVLNVRKKHVEKGIQVRESLLDTAVPTPLLAIRAEQQDSPPLAAFIVHGYQCNKAMMVQLGKYLALNGINSYLIDLPGHGSSRARFDSEACYAIVRDTIRRLVDAERLDPTRVALIGHSLGAMIVAKIGIENSDFRASVLIGPGFEPGFTHTAPANTLFVVGEGDHPFIREATRRMVRAATGKGEVAAQTLYGSFRSGNARQLVVIPGVGHVGLVYTQEVYSKTADWIFLSLLDRGRPSGPHGSPSLLAVSLLSAALAVAFVTLVSIWIVTVVPPHCPGPNSFVSTKPTFDLLILILAWVFSLNVLAYSVPLRFLSLEEGEVIASLLFLGGLLGMAGWLAFRRRIRILPTRQTVRVLAIAGAMFALYYFAAMLFVSQELYQMTLNVDRAWRCTVIAASIFPLFLLEEGIFRGIQGKRAGTTWRILNSFWGGTAFLSVVACSAIIRDVELARFVPLMIAVVTGLQALSCSLYEVTPTHLLTAAFQCLVIGWVLSVGFAIN